MMLLAAAAAILGGRHSLRDHDASSVASTYSSELGVLLSNPTVAVRFVFTKLRDANRELQLQELMLYAEAVDVDAGMPLSISNISNPGGLSPPNGQLPLRLVDGDTESKHSKFVDLAFPTNGQTVLELTLAEPASVLSYELITANDNPGRDPTAWHVSYLVGGRWQQVHAVSGVQPPTNRHTSYGRMACHLRVWPCRLSVREEPVILNRQDNAVIELLHLKVRHGPAITCQKSSGVTLRNLRIEHNAADGAGIYFDNCHGMLIEDVSIVEVFFGRF